MKLNNKEFNLLILFAFRYALGRRCTAPGIVCDLIRKNRDKIMKITKITIVYEINDAYEKGLLGDECDIEERLSLKKELEE